MHGQSQDAGRLRGGEVKGQSNSTLNLFLYPCMRPKVVQKELAQHPDSGLGQHGSHVTNISVLSAQNKARKIVSVSIRGAVIVRKQLIFFVQFCAVTQRKGKAINSLYAHSTIFGILVFRPQPSGLRTINFSFVEY